MRMSFDDKESFKEAVESQVRFDNVRQQIGSSNSMALEYSERNEGDIIPSDPIIPHRVGSTSSLSHGVQETRRSGIVFNNPGPSGPSNPEFTDSDTLANGVVEEVYGGPRRSQGRSEDAERY